MERAEIQPVNHRTGLPASKPYTQLGNTSILDHWSIADWRISTLCKQPRCVLSDGRDRSSMTSPYTMDRGPFDPRHTSTSTGRLDPSLASTTLKLFHSASAYPSRRNLLDRVASLSPL
ncbi:hypothetical protein BKA70DRAFT_1562267 [Coprinopsis sp. MPI-PUGE-AT-0042]|nr:hypothetical protein BKA70DRAFT_1562267 [Coprinopsis sp. MPI-PUGE-AT-0042]